MGEISSANHEQEAGIAQINLAVTDMDAVTQQNAALVEEAAAAASSLQDQAVQLAQAVSVFKLAEGVAGRPMAAPRERAARPPSAASPGAPCAGRGPPRARGRRPPPAAKPPRNGAGGRRVGRVLRDCLQIGLAIRQGPAQRKMR